MFKLVLFYHIIKIIVGDYGFKLIQKIKIVIDNYDFILKVKTVIDNYDFKIFLNRNH